MTQTQRTLIHFVDRNVPTLIWGEPGAGKTAFVTSLAAARGWPCIVVVASHYDPVELHGIMTVQRNQIVRALPDWAEPALFEEERDSILFLDELSTASPAQQAAMLRVIAERVVGGRRLSRRCRIIAAANPPECSAGGAELTPPAANRFAHLEWATDAEDFTSAFPSLFGSAQTEIPPAIEAPEEEYPRTRALLAAFLRRAPQYVHATPRDPYTAGRAWPSPRTWELCSRAIAGLRDSALRLRAAAACVGDAAATELAAWLEQIDIPDPADIVAGKNPAIPLRSDIVFAALSAAAEFAIVHARKDAVRNVWIWAAACAAAGHRESAAVAVRSMIRRAAQVYLPVGPDAELLRPFKEVLAGI